MGCSWRSWILSLRQLRKTKHLLFHWDANSSSDVSDPCFGAQHDMIWWQCTIAYLYDSPRRCCVQTEALQGTIADSPWWHIPGIATFLGLPFPHGAVMNLSESAERGGRGASQWVLLVAFTNQYGLSSVYRNFEKKKSLFKSDIWNKTCSWQNF